MKLGASFGWHVHPWETLLELVRHAEALGYETAWVDGDVTMLDVRREADVLDGWTATAALLARTERIGIGSLRIAHHWNAARLAQAVASAERITPGRLRFLVSIGDRPHDESFGLPGLPVRERIRWLHETLDALRALWRGETVSRDGRYVKLRGARIRPTPPGGRIPIAVAGKGPRLLEVAAAHADVWEINLPPLAEPVSRASAALESACRRRGRDPSEIARSMWIFARIGEELDPDALAAEYRRLNPWFAWIPDSALPAARVSGSAEACRHRLIGLIRELALDRPVLDFSGLDAAATRRALEALAPGHFVDAPDASP